MVAEGYLIAAEFLCEVEELFAPIPRTEETGLFLTPPVLACHLERSREISPLALLGRDDRRGFLDCARNDKAGCLHVEGNAQVIAKGLQISGVRFVVDILHPHVQGLYTESWVVNLCALR